MVDGDCSFKSEVLGLSVDKSSGVLERLNCFMLMDLEGMEKAETDEEERVCTHERNTISPQESTRKPRVSFRW